MRHALAFVAGLALLAPGSLQAQKSTTPADDLRCAAWAAITLGRNEDPEAKSTLTIAVFLFLGRYEAATGIPFERALTPEYLDDQAAEILAAGEECQARVAEMADRMSKHGDNLQQSGR